MGQKPRSVGNIVAELLRAQGIHVQQRRVPGAAQLPANLHQLLNFSEARFLLFIKGNKNVYCNWHVYCFGAYFPLCSQRPHTSPSLQETKLV